MSIELDFAPVSYYDGVPVTGDWNGDGITEIGVFRNGTWVLDMNGNGAWNGAMIDKTGTFGLATDKPVSGTW